MKIWPGAIAERLFRPPRGTPRYPPPPPPGGGGGSTRTYRIGKCIVYQTISPCSPCFQSFGKFHIMSEMYYTSRATNGLLPLSVSSRFIARLQCLISLVYFSQGILSTIFKYILYFRIYLYFIFSYEIRSTIYRFISHQLFIIIYYNPICWKLNWAIIIIISKDIIIPAFCISPAIFFRDI